MLAGSALWWWAALATRLAGSALPWAVPPAVAHGLVMALAFNPLFMAGFMFTAGPRWLGLPEVPGRSLVRPLTVYALAWLVAGAGLHLQAGLAAAALATATGAWITLVWRFARLVSASRVPDRLHARAVAAAGAVGAAAMAAAAVALTIGHAGGVRAATALALWGFIAPVFAIVSHRMLPFFTHSALPAIEAWRPHALLGWMLGALAVSGLASAAEMLTGELPASAHAVMLAVQGTTGVLLLWLALRWGLVHSFSVKLLAMLHGGFVWLGLAFTLGAVSHALALWQIGPGSLGLAPLHALTVGFLGVTLVAMITRVAAGHSGRPLVADAVALTFYAAVQLAAVTRVAAALWPEVPGVLLIAAAAWALAACGWAWRYGGWMGRPRADGRPG